MINQKFITTMTSKKNKLSFFVFTLMSLNTILAQTSLKLNFENVFGDKPVQFGNEYVTDQGESVKITLLNYFISNIKLTKSDGSTFSIPVDNSYFLVRQDAPESKIITLDVPKGKYKGVSFMIGVDSVRNTMSADKRTGVLDIGAAARDMYWAWHSGYIFFKLEGKSSASPDSFKNSFFYHIGGYGGYDTKTINNIKIKTSLFSKTIKTKKGKSADIAVKVDIKKVFDGPFPLSIAKSPSVMWGPVSVSIADNYANTFELK